MFNTAIKRFGAFVLIISMLISAMLCCSAARLNSDRYAAGASAWAVSEVSEAISLDLVPDNLRSNYQTGITRAEFATMSVRLIEKVYGAEINTVLSWLHLADADISFADTTDKQVIAAAKFGVVQGVGDDKFAPDKTLTRQEAATMLARIASHYSGIKAADIYGVYSDASSIANWASRSVGICYSLGVMKGSSNNCFLPAGTYTREESILTILRMYKAINELVLTDDTLGVNMSELHIHTSNLNGYGSAIKERFVNSDTPDVVAQVLVVEGNGSITVDNPSVIKVDADGFVYDPVILTKGDADRTTNIRILDKNGETAIVIPVTVSYWDIDDINSYESNTKFGNALLAGINAERAKRGLSELEYANWLYTAATQRATDIGYLGTGDDVNKLEEYLTNDWRPDHGTVSEMTATLTGSDVTPEALAKRYLEVWMQDSEFTSLIYSDDIYAIAGSVYMRWSDMHSFADMLVLHNDNLTSLSQPTFSLNMYQIDAEVAYVDGVGVVNNLQNNVTHLVDIYQVKDGQTYYPTNFLLESENENVVTVDDHGAVTVTHIPVKGDVPAKTNIKVTNRYDGSYVLVPVTIRPMTTYDTTTAEYRNRFANELLRLCNEARAAKGIAPMTYAPEIQAGSDIRAKECLQKYDHVRPNGQKFDTAFDAKYTLGENLAGSYQPWWSHTPEEMALDYFTQWKNSPGHWAAILSAHHVKMVTSIAIDYDYPGHSYACMQFIYA